MQITVNGNLFLVDNGGIGQATWLASFELNGVLTVHTNELRRPECDFIIVIDNSIGMR